MKDTLIITALAVVLAGYTVFYLSSRQYIKETFQQTTFADTTIPTKSGYVAVSPGQTKEVSLTPVDVPFTQKPINDLDDYEENIVYLNESEKALSKDLKRKLMSQYPMDWSGYPPSSSQFQAGLRESFQNAKPTVPDDAKPYENIDGDLMQPPDLSELEKKEKKILQTYTPKFPPTPTSYDPRDAQELIRQIYDVKGVIPEVRHKDGTNVYEIIGVRNKNEKVVFEDEEGAATDGANPSTMESTIKVPMAARDERFNKNGKKWDYTAWTPGLERMFAPSESEKNWY
jgi:hypothetical protein